MNRDALLENHQSEIDDQDLVISNQQSEINNPKTINNQQSAIKNQLSFRPWHVTWLLYGVLIITIYNAVRFVQALQQFEFLQELLPISPLYLAISGLVWALLGLVLAWGLWRGSRWVPWLMLGAALAYTLYYWLDQLLLSPDAPGANWLFAGGMNLILLLFIVWSLSRRQARVFFDRGRKSLPGSS